VKAGKTPEHQHSQTGAASLAETAPFVGPLAGRCQSRPGSRA